MLGTVAAVFVPSLSTYRNNQALANLQENERYLISTMSTAVDQAGFIGCDSREPANVANATSLSGSVASTASWLRNFGAPVRILPSGTDASAYTGTGNGIRPSATSGNFPAGDVLTLLSAGLNTFVVTNHDAAAETITFRGDLLSELNDKVITINDCRNIAVFQIGAGVVVPGSGSTPTTTVFSYSTTDTNNCAGGGTTRVLLGSEGGIPDCSTAANRALFGEYTFRSGTNSAEMVAQSFFIGTDPTDGINSLYAAQTNPDGSFSGIGTRLVAGVDNMRVRYGIRRSTGGIEYRTAPAFSPPQDIDGTAPAETFADVVAIEATFLLNSGLTRGVRGTTETQNFSFPPVDGTADVTCDETVSSNNEYSACPIYVSNTSINRGQLRRVVRKVFNLRNVTL